MTWFAPMRARILPCDWLMAFAQICGILRSTRLAVMSTLDSTDEPVATTATAKSCAPIWRSASMLRASACTVCVTRSAHFCTSAGSVSTANTSRSRRSSWPAVAAPKRPRPMTSTGASWGIRSTNDGPLFRSPEQLPALGGRQCGGQGHCTNAPGPHGGRERVLSWVGERLSESRREPGGRKRRDHVEEHEIERRLGEVEDEDARGRHDRGAPQGDADGEPKHVDGDAALEGLHVLVAARLRKRRQEQHGERRHLDAARR